MNKIVENALAAHRAKNDAEGEKVVNADANEYMKKEAGKIRDLIVRSVEELEKGKSNCFRWYLEALARIEYNEKACPEISSLKKSLANWWDGGSSKCDDWAASLKRGPATLFDRLAKTGKL